MCDPTYEGNGRNGFSLTGALPDSPVAGHWFSAQFQELLANAHPPLDGGGGPGGPGEDDTTAPTAPTGLKTTATSATTVSLAWTAATDDTGVTGYDVYRDGTRIGSTTTTAYADSGLTSGTAYTYTVRAKDAAGNVSPPSASSPPPPTRAAAPPAPSRSSTAPRTPRPPTARSGWGSRSSTPARAP